MLVCHEAALVAREAGSRVVEDTHHRLLQIPTWIQPDRDKVFQSYFEYDIWGYPAPFQLMNRRFGVASSITVYNLWRFEAKMDSPTWVLTIIPVVSATTHAPQVAGLEHVPNVPNGEVIPVVHFSLSLHIPEAAALSSGLFGLLGDEPVQLVDVGDAVRLQAYFDLLRYHGPQEMGSFGSVLPTMMNPALLSAPIQNWKRATEMIMLVYMWLDDKHKIEENHSHATGGDPFGELYSAWDPPYSNEPCLVLLDKQFDETSNSTRQAPGLREHV